MFFFFFFLQFAAWVDAVIFVFSLENEASFNAIYTYYHKMAHLRNSTEIPFILVGTQGKASITIYFILLFINVITRVVCSYLKKIIYYIFYRHNQWRQPPSYRRYQSPKARHRIEEVFLLRNLCYLWSQRRTCIPRWWLFFWLNFFTGINSISI